MRMPTPVQLLHVPSYTIADLGSFPICWFKDEALEESANLPAPEVIAADIVADLEAAPEQFRVIEEDVEVALWRASEW